MNGGAIPIIAIASITIITLPLLPLIVAAGSYSEFNLTWPGGMYSVSYIKGSPRIFLGEGNYYMTLVDKGGLRFIFINNPDITWQKLEGVELSSVEKSGRIYPEFKIMLAGCPSQIYVFRGSKNITDIYSYSRALDVFNVSNNGCIVSIHSLKVYSLGFISSENPLMLTLKLNGTYSYAIVGLAGKESIEAGSRVKEFTATQEASIGDRVQALGEPVKITASSGGLGGQSYIKYLIALVLSILMVAALVYEHGRSRQGN